MTTEGIAAPERASELVDALGRLGLMAILRYPAGGDVARAIDAISSGGLTVVEVTVDTPGAWAAITAAAGHPDLIVGGGTVTEVDQVERLAACGARFVVSPGLQTDVVAAAVRLGLESFPGVATGTEILAARHAGSRFVKLFPAGALGPRYLRELRGPFAQELFVPTGGIAIGDLSDWIGAGAFAVAIGSDLAGRAAPRDAAGAAALRDRAARAVATARAALDVRAEDS